MLGLGTSNKCQLMCNSPRKRKDFPLAGLPTELPDEEIADASGTKVIAAPMAGGPFVAQPDGSVTTSTGRGPRALDQAWNEQQEKPAAG